MSEQVESGVGLTRRVKTILSADALGITACLYAHSHLPFLDNPTLAETYAEQYHRLRDYMLEHAEARGMVGAID